MSEQTLPDGRQAYDHVYRNVYAGRFFQKCAEYGISPRTESEAVEMLQSAAGLRTLEEAEQTKQASAGIVSDFHRNLDGLMRQYGVGGHDAGQASAFADAAREKAAAAYVEDPDTFNAILALKLDEAEQIRARLVG